MVTATESEVEVAKAALAEAKNRLAAAEEVLNGPRRRYEKAMREYLAAQAKLNSFGETRMMGGRRI